MAAIQLENKLRPCYVAKYDTQGTTVKKVGEVKALFHCLVQVSEIRPPSPLKGGHSGGVVSGVLGVVELENGIIRKVDLEDIRFCDNIFQGYVFPETKYSLGGVEETCSVPNAEEKPE